jgi:small conductance mechanosensitive channel
MAEIRRFLAFLSLHLVFLLPASGATSSDAPLSATAEAEARLLREKFEAARTLVTDRSDAIRRELGRIETALKDMQLQSGGRLSPDQDREAAALAARRSSLQDQLAHLQTMLNARQSAVEARDTQDQLAAELALFQKRASAGRVYYGRAEIEYLKASAELAQSLLATIERSASARKDQLASVQEQLSKHDAGADEAVLDAKRDALIAQIESSAESRRSWQARLKLLETKLAVASPATAGSLSTNLTTSGPAADQKDAENKQKIAEALERQARGEREEARRRLKQLRERMSQAILEGRDASALEDDLEFYERKFDYETRRMRQADFERRIALEKRQIASIESDLKAARQAAVELGKSAGRYLREERQRSAAEYRAKVEACRRKATQVMSEREKGQPDAAIWDRLVRSIDTLDEALRDRLARGSDPDHVFRMRGLLDAERLQVAVMQNSSEVISFAQLRQMTLQNKLADVYQQCADILDPPQPGFWERNRTIMNALWIVLVAVGCSFALRLVIYAVKNLIQLLGTRMPGRFSVKRIETLLSFSASILRVLIAFFAVILVLSEFGFDPAKSTAVFGLISLALTGMFQQIVIDFVKGFDIITGRHYNVGDFVELDGKTGHVIDFSVKHTRIRTASGQEYNLPNSRCIPSRRFPDGYVDNYVDVPVRSSNDVQRARRAIAPVCRHLSRRIEQVKDEPTFIDQFPAARPGSMILRYRVRVLPACDWVIVEQFIPDVKAALAEQGIELADEPSFFFINRIQVFRQLFSRELTEEEILKEAQEQQRPTLERDEMEEESERLALQKAG